MGHRFSGAKWVAVLWAAFSACGGAADPAASGTGVTSGANIPVSAGPKSEARGSRLRRVWRTGSDNSVVAAGYYDAALKARCEFTSVASGVDLCVPEDVYTLTYDEWFSHYSTSNRALYTDSTCKKSDVALLNSAPCTSYGVVRVLPDPSSTYVSACGGTQIPTWFSATPLPVGTPVYYFGVPAGGGTCCSCQPLKATPSGGTLMKVEPLTPTNADQASLVRAQLSVDP